MPRTIIEFSLVTYSYQTELDNPADAFVSHATSTGSPESEGPKTPDRPLTPA